MSKPPSPPLPTFRQLQKSVYQLAGDAAEVTGDAAQKAVQHLREFDSSHGLTDSVAKTGKRIQDAAKEVDIRYDISAKATTTVRTAADGVERMTAAVKQVAAEHGLIEALHSHVVDPVKQASQSAASSEVVRKSLGAIEDAYGATRRVAKDAFAPDFPTYDSYELLQAAKSELNYIAACLLQISPEESSHIGTQFGRAVTAKVAGAAGTSTLLAIVATFGHAGTGAAISGLSGAAATSATMAWVGGLVGGGVAAGAALTGGLTMVIGLAAYKLLASERRDFESMTPLEQRIVQSCWMLASVADAYQKRPREFTPIAARELLKNSLTPLLREIEANIPVLCEPLDGKNTVALRQHALLDFRSAVIDRFYVYLDWADSEAGRDWHQAQDTSAKESSAKQSHQTESEADLLRLLRAGNAEAAIGGVFAALLTRSALDGTTESRLVVEALRRTSTQLHDASEQDLGDYLRSLPAEGLKGMGSNVKGIYHELWYVEQYNATHDDTFARLFEATNHPGADVQICDADTGAMIRQVQLKAVDSAGAVQDHLRRYPDIDVAATEEVAGKFHHERVNTSGFSNDALHEESGARLDELRDHTVTSRTGDTALIALGIASTAELVEMLRGERAFPEAVLNVAAKFGTAAGATALTAILFG